MPDRFSWAAAEMSLNWPWRSSKRRFTARPTTARVMITKGRITIEMSVSWRLTLTIATTVNTTTAKVATRFTTPIESIIRTALRSFVMRAIRSPMR